MDSTDATLVVTTPDGKSAELSDTLRDRLGAYLDPQQPIEFGARDVSWLYRFAGQLAEDGQPVAAKELRSICSRIEWHGAVRLQLRGST